MSHVRVGLAGVGFSRFLAKAIDDNPRASVVALCDIVEDRMQKLGQELGHPVKFFTDYAEMCRDPEIDAVFIGTPNQWHVPIALEAVRHDKHVLITKPLADAVEPARQLVAAAESAGVVNMMSLSLRFSPEVRYLGQLAAENFFGQIYYARARSVRRSGIPSWSPGFIQKGGGAFRDMGVHFLDSAWWIMGMPTPVSVFAGAGAQFGPRGLGFWKYVPQPPEYAQQYAADDYAGGMIRFDNDAMLHIESFWACHQPEERQIELFGTEAGAKYQPLTVYQTVNNAPMDSTIQLQEGPGVWDVIASHFIECILDNVECTAPLRHGLIVQEMMEAVLISGETGKEVPIELGGR